jgi:hypothetical protein
MWNTPLGIKQISGTNKQLIMIGVKSITQKICNEKINPIKAFQNLIENDKEFCGNAPSVFLSMPDTQKIVAIHNVCNDMFSINKPPKQYAWNEATVKAIFDSINDEIINEIKLNNTNEIRETILKIYHEICEEKIEFNPNNKKKWFDVIDHLSGLILWNNNYEMQFDDIEPEVMKEIKKYMSVEKDYWIKPAPIDNTKSIKLAVKELYELIHPFQMSQEELKIIT